MTVFTLGLCSTIVTFPERCDHTVWLQWASVVVLKLVTVMSSNDTGHPAGFGTICHGNGLLLALFESLIEEQSGLLLLYRLIGLARKTLTLHSSSASQDTVDTETLNT